MATTPPASQTLSRGIRILEILAEADAPLTIDQLAARLEVHRSVAYRLLRTLEDHRLVSRTPTGSVVLGAKMAALAAGVSRDLQAAALPELTSVANELAMTAFLAVRDDADCVTLVSVEPTRALARVAQRPGVRHRVTAGAPGKAILAQLGRDELAELAGGDLLAAIEAVRAAGYATSHDEVVPTLRSVAVPLALRGHQPAALAVVHVVVDADEGAIAHRLRVAADALRRELDG